MKARVPSSRPAESLPHGLPDLSPLLPEPLHILIVEDSPDDAQLVVAELRRNHCPIKYAVVDDAESMRAALAREPWDLVIADYAMPKFNGLAALHLLRERHPDRPFILVSGTIGEELAVDAMKAGAQDYVMKDRFARLAPAVMREVREAEVRRDRRRAEEARRASEALYQATFQEAPVGIAHTSPEGRFVRVNSRFCAMFGYSEAELLNLRFQDVTHPDDVGADEDGVRRLLAGETQVYRGEKRYRHKDGRIVWGSRTVSVQHDADGRPQHFIAVVVDVTEEKQAAARVAEQARLLDLASDAIFVRDLEGRIRYWNQGAERLYGWRADEVLDRPVAEANRRTFEEVRQELLDLGNLQKEFRHFKRTGEEIVVNSRSTVMRDSEGRPVSFLFISTDITEQKRLEAHVLRAQRLESIGRVAAGVAHDLNNILEPLLMAAPLLRQECTSTEALAVLDALESSARRGADMIRQLLTVGREVPGERVAVTPNRLVQEVTDLLQPTLPKTITFQTRLPAGLWHVTGDPTQLQRALLNLCVNARDAMPGGGRLSISGENVRLDSYGARAHSGTKAGAYLRLTVADTGEGMSREVLDRIFDPFFTTKAVGHGTGLGLSTALTLVRSHGGFIDVQSELGKGSAFSVFLPAATS